MKISLLAAALLIFGIGKAQLTVEKIMRDPKWIGSSPSNVFWSQDSKSVFFGWNPSQQTSDSIYQFSIGATDPIKTKYVASQKAIAISNGILNSSNTQLAYVYRGDIFLLDLKSNN